jgi:N-acylglucosamine-6-phosphate 2-epimerase
LAQGKEDMPRIPLSQWLPGARGRLIVSCQALEGEPLHGAEIMARLALAAQQGGAAAIRANSPADIRAIRAAVPLPIIGLYKERIAGFEPYITPTVKHAQQIAEAGADVIAVDATNRPRPEGLSLAAFFQRIHEATGCPILADISTLEEAVAAAEAGAELVSTTLSGYTPYSPQITGPDLELVSAASRLPVPLLAEGRYHYPEWAAEALRRGAYAVIVGGAITRPAEIAARFAAVMSQASRIAD